MTKPKRILVACNHLKTVGGSELYSYYLIKSLLENGHHVEYFTFNLGMVSSKIELDLNVGFKSDNHYDLILASHQTTVNYLFGQGPILQICHGPIPDLEQPSPLADFHISVSEEVASHLKDKGYSSTVILNGIDLEVLKPRRSLNKRPKKILSLCQSREANTLIAAICEEEDLEFNSINKHTNPKFEISNEINDVDLVIGIGRSAYDAMACGRPCILFDKRSYNGSLGDGYLFPNKFRNFSKYNCSGRFSKRSFTRRDLVNEIKKYNSDHGKQLREIATEELNQSHVSKELVEIGKNLSGWSHRKHYLKIIMNYYRFQEYFSTVKRSFRAKMKEDFLSGISTKAIKAAIDKENFILPLRFSLYLYWLQLKK
ncbi:glycosyltransferase family protein [Lunatibacter salilacus]|uniref:UDP-glycosyltransferase n=1 Tax=Lunatibacter salilacus TaxID=2483804 RepID=UPI00131A8D6B|nr:UDP-glycosyltransferase [Lunatibacter salilacus]